MLNTLVNLQKLQNQMSFVNQYGMAAKNNNSYLLICRRVMDPDHPSINLPGLFNQEAVASIF